MITLGHRKIPLQQFTCPTLVHDGIASGMTCSVMTPLLRQFARHGGVGSIVLGLITLAGDGTTFELLGHHYNQREKLDGFWTSKPSKLTRFTRRLAHAA